MKYVQFTYVDSQTGVPVSEAPASNGPTIPDGIIPTFDIESSRASPSPVVYGFVAEDYEGEIPSFVQEVKEEDFFATFKMELKERARNKRKQVERGGIEVNDFYIPTTIKDQNRITTMYMSLLSDPDRKEVDFEYSHGEWVTFTREQGLAIGKAVGAHVQECVSWCKNIHKKIDELELTIETLDSVLPILQEINSFGMTDPTPEEQE